MGRCIHLYYYDYYYISSSITISSIVSIINIIIFQRIQVTCDKKVGYGGGPGTCSLFARIVKYRSIPALVAVTWPVSRVSCLWPTPCVFNPHLTSISGYQEHVQTR